MVLKCLRKRGVTGFLPPPGGPMAAISTMSTRFIYTDRQTDRERGRGIVIIAIYTLIKKYTCIAQKWLFFHVQKLTEYTYMYTAKNA